MNATAANPSDVTIVGFDLGHAETTLAKTRGASATSPEPVPLKGAPSGHPLLTVVGVQRNGTVMVGQEAAGAHGLTELHVAFKSPHFDDPTVSKPVQLFVEKVVEDAQENGHIPGNGAIHWTFGAPAGWPKQVRERYAQLLRNVGLGDAEVISESRGALLYARDAGDVRVDEGRLRSSVLIVDIGSSTTDYTRVRNLAPQPIDHGNVALGAGLIDAEIMRRVLVDPRLNPAVRMTVQSCPSEQRRLELICRRAKEEYFSAPEEALVTDPFAERGYVGRLFPPEGRPVTVEVWLTKADMEAVLDTPLPALGNRSWRTAFREDFAAALAQFGGTPYIVLLTGGPSRMPFVVDICRELVGADRVLVGGAPELAISRGLAIAGRIGVKTYGFRQDVARLTGSPKFRSIIADQIPMLAQQIGAAVATGMTERHVIPAFRQWRNREIITLNAMTQQIVQEVNSYLAGGQNSPLNQIVATWQNDVQIRIDQLTRPICERWGLPAGALSLPHIDVRTGQISVPVDTTVVTEVLSGAATAVSAVVAAVVSTTLFGAGVALIATTGPVAPLVAAAAIFGGLMVGKDAMMERVMTADIPIPLRRMNNESTMIRKLRAAADSKETELATAMTEKILNYAGGRLSKEISSTVAVQLTSKADNIEMLVS